MAERKVVVLRCSDGTEQEVEEAVAMMSVTIRRLIEAGCNRVIDLTDISPAALCKVIEFCSKHAAAASSSSGPSAPAASSLKDWDADFINSMDDTMISQIIAASDYLEVTGLQPLIARKRLITLSCGVDGDKFVVEAPIALNLKIVRSILQTQPISANCPIILPNVTSSAHDSVLEFYRKHSWAEEVKLNKRKIKEMDQDFVRFYAPCCFDLMRAAAYLEASSLLELLVDSVKAVPRFAELMRDNIVADVVGGHYTKEEENAIVAELSNVLA